jgi:hypothetical protein
MATTPKRKKPLLQRCPTCRGAVWVICPTCRGNQVSAVILPRAPEPSEDEVREARRLMRLEA